MTKGAISVNGIKIGSLFDGSAGFPLAAIMNGMDAVWASEVEPYPRRVTTKRLPLMKHYGDISQMDGAEIEPVDVITGGSPCQDMSVAGKRAGLDGERSGLFREQIRIIKEMREASDGKYPRFMVWENVPGAFSSNKGADFKCVLEETARIKDASFNVPMPPKGKWNTAGLIVDNESNFSIGWRVLDAQYWGVPQRRRRIFLVADFSGTSAEEILFKRDGLSWHFAESREAWQTASENIRASSCKSSKKPIYSISRGAINAGYEFDCKPGIDESEIAYTLIAGGPGGVAHPSNYLFENHSQDARYRGPLDVSQTVTATFGMGSNNQPFVVENTKCFDVRFTSEGTKNVRANVYETDTARTIDTGGNAPDSNQGGVAVICMATQQGGAEIAENLSPTITAAAGMSGNNQPVLCVSRTHGISVSENVVQTIQAAAGESGNNQPMICEPIQVLDQGGGKSQCNVIENISPTLTCTHQGEPVICEPISAETHNRVAYSFDSMNSNSMKSKNPYSGCREVEIAKTLDCSEPNPSKNQGGIAIIENAYSLQGNMIGRSDENGPQGSGVNEGVSFTLNATDQHGVCCMDDRKRACPVDENGKAFSLVATDYKGCQKVCYPQLASGKQSVGTLMANAGTKLWLGNQEAFSGDYHILEQNYIVRRLTPLECARLQGFPDWWTANLGTKEEDITEEMMNFWREVFETHRKVVTGASKPKTDKQIKNWLINPDNDSAEYKMWGNGVALPCVLYVMEGVSEVLRASLDYPIE